MENLDVRRQRTRLVSTRIICAVLIAVADVTSDIKGVTRLANGVLFNMVCTLEKDKIRTSIIIEI